MHKYQPKTRPKSDYSTRTFTKNPCNTYSPKIHAILSAASVYCMIWLPNTDNRVLLAVLVIIWCISFSILQRSQHRNEKCLSDWYHFFWLTDWQRVFSVQFAGTKAALKMESFHSLIEVSFMRPSTRRSLRSTPSCPGSSEHQLPVLEALNIKTCQLVLN